MKRGLRQHGCIQLKQLRDLLTESANLKKGVNNMLKTLKIIRKYVGRRTPENIKSVFRRVSRYIRPVGNPAIPIEELKIFELLRDRISVVFDVGAREDLSYYKMKNDCSYHLFEPNVTSVSALKSQISALNNPDIKLNEFGLADVKADNCVYYEESQSFVVNPFHTGIDKGHRYSLRRLDDYVSENSVGHIDFLKIDAEGLDYKIIVGGLQTVKMRVSFIQFEYWDGVRKFIDLIGGGFDYYLMMEPRLLEGILEDAWDEMSARQRSRNYAQSILKLDTDLVALIDGVLTPIGIGGNILGISKSVSIDVADITFAIH
jgi:FkbM family methyltransferase